MKVVRVLLAGAGIALGLFLLGGVNLIYDLPAQSLNSADARVGIYTHSRAETRANNFLFTWWERADPSTFAVVLRQDRAPNQAALHHSVLRAEVKSSAHRSAITVTCGRTEPEFCQPLISAHLDDGAIATVSVTDFDASGAELQHQTYRFDLKRKRMLHSRFWDTAMSA